MSEKSSRWHYSREELWMQLSEKSCRCHCQRRALDTTDLMTAEVEDPARADRAELLLDPGWAQWGRQDKPGPAALAAGTRDHREDQSWGCSCRYSSQAEGSHLGYSKVTSKSRNNMVHILHSTVCQISTVGNSLFRSKSLSLKSDREQFALVAL